MSFRTLIAYCFEEYQNLPNQWFKHEFLEAILGLIMGSGGIRRQSNGEWREVTNEEARNKVSQELRDEAKHPHIVSYFSLADTPCIEGHFRSAYVFVWDGIVEACKQELLEPRLDLEMLLEPKMNSEEQLSWRTSFGVKDNDVASHIFHSLYAYLFTTSSGGTASFNFHLVHTSLVIFM